MWWWRADYTWPVFSAQVPVRQVYAPSCGRSCPQTPPVPPKDSLPLCVARAQAKDGCADTWGRGRETGGSRHAPCNLEREARDASSPRETPARLVLPVSLCSCCQHFRASLFSRQGLVRSRPEMQTEVRPTRAVESQPACLPRVTRRDR